MAELKNVIYDIERCICHVPDACRDCSHYPDKNGGPIGCMEDLLSEALELLKEWEAKTQGADSGMCEICSFYERALPVKPHYNARTNWYECGACHYSMTSGMHCLSVLIPAYKVGYCAKCGKAVDWGKPTET